MCESEGGIVPISFVCLCLNSLYPAGMQRIICLFCLHCLSRKNKLNFLTGVYSCLSFTPFPFLSVLTFHNPSLSVSTHVLPLATILSALLSFLHSSPHPLSPQLHTDMDRNDGRTKYVLRGEGAGSVFVIDEKTGNIHVTKPLDREEKDEYRLIATATDRQTDRALEPSSQFIIRVQDINDNPPVFDEGPYSATVPEMANIGTETGVGSGRVGVEFI